MSPPTVRTKERGDSGRLRWVNYIGVKNVKDRGRTRFSSSKGEPGSVPEEGLKGLKRERGKRSGKRCALGLNSKFWFSVVQW